ncbi:hypothetical protein BGX21_007425 [Mortierella sp. AD011]|nr:hypothetical protein BGX21_007425 [Mortierella sp. AD011]
MQNLDLLVNRCMDGWREACDLLRDERLVLEAFYTMHQYVACLATIFSKSECRLAISDDMQESLVGWSVEIIGGAHELLLLVQDDEKALSKISCTVESLVAFLQAVQPIQCTQLIHVLDTIVSWESLPCEKRPLSRLSIASFLSSCSSVEIPEESYMIKMKSLLESLYDNLIKDKEWPVIHASLTSLNEFYSATPDRHLPDAYTTDLYRDKLRQMIEQRYKRIGYDRGDPHAFWAAMDMRTRCLQSQRFNNNEISSLQEMSGMQPSPQACVSALATLARYLESPNRDKHGNDMVRDMLTSELARIHRLSQSHKQTIQQ